MHPTSKTIIASAVTLLLSGSLFAQETKKDNVLPAVTVSGTSILPSSVENLPGSYSVMTREQLEERRPFSILETIREIPGLHVVSEDAAGTHLNIGMRGLNPRRSSRTLLLEDGAPTVFFAPYGDPSSHYSTPLERIERIEVLKGSGQILYGPQTMGGMINFVTRPVPRNGTEGSIKITGGNRGYYDGHFNVGTGTENGGFMVDVLKKRGDGIRDEHQFDVQDVALKGQFKIDRDQRITGKYSNFQEDSQFSETGLTAEEYRISPTRGADYDPNGRGERFTMKRNTAQVVHEWDLNPDMKLSTQFYYSQTDRTSRRSREFEISTPTGALENDAFAIRPRTYEFFGVEPKVEMKHNAFGLPNQSIFGFRYHQESIDRQKFTTSAANINGPFDEADERLTAKIKALSYYAQNTLFVGDWSFTPGLRLEDVTSRKNLFGPSVPNGPQFDQLNNSLTTSKLQALPGFGLTWNGLKTATIFGGVHRGFAPPRPDRDIDGSTLQRVTPELATTTEVGIRSSLMQSGYIESTLFNMDISDIVVQSNNIFRNEGKAQHTGFEVAGKINFGELTGKKNNYYASLAYTNLFIAKFKNSGVVGGEGEDGYGSYATGNRLPYAPKHTLALNLSYEDPIGYQARVGVTHVSQQFANTDNFRGLTPEGHCVTAVGNDCGLFGEIPSLTLVNASMSYAPKGQKVTYFMSGENLTDKKYFSSRTNGLQPGRGRMIFAGMRYSF